MGPGQSHSELVTPMSIVKEMRERQTITVSSGSSGLGGTVLVGCAAFAIGILAIAGWKIWPGAKSSAPSNQPGAAASSAVANQPPKFSGKRLDEAEHAPLLATCVADEGFGGFGDTKNPQAAYAMMKMLGTHVRVATLIGAETGNGIQITDNWRIIAECVYRQNSWNLCNPNNRALAIESAEAFVRRAAAVIANPPKGSSGQTTAREYSQARERVLDALRSRVRNGYLIANDFSFVQSPEIKKVLSETKTVANGCEKS